MSLFPRVLFLVSATWRVLSIAVSRAIGARPEIPPPCLSRSPSAQILHKIPQILNISNKRAANRRRIVRPWGKSSSFNSGDRGCRGGCSTTAGGWKRRLFPPPSSPCRNATRRSPSPRPNPAPHPRHLREMKPCRSRPYSILKLLPRSEYPPPPASLLTKWLFIGLPIDVKFGRAWSFRAWHLERYLANNPTIPPNSSDSGKG